VAEIEAGGGRALALPLNVGDGEAVAAFFAEHIQGQVHLAVLVHNAGITQDGFLVRMKDDYFDRVFPSTCAVASSAPAKAPRS
jgi:Dehydrogenases with different specificities (related to short-chain alcohol dehydrogenases)